MKPPKKPYFCETKFGNTVQSEVRAHDGQVLVVVRHGDSLLKLEPVDSEKELAWWFWNYVQEFGGEK